MLYKDVICMPYALGETRMHQLNLHKADKGWFLSACTE